jgi:chemotaxis protein CheC
MSETTIDPKTLDGMELDALREVGNIGAGNAAQALSSMLGQPVEMTVPSARAVAIERVPEEVGFEEEPVAAAHLRVTGDAPGEMIYLLPIAAAKALTGTMLAQMGAPAEETDSPYELGEMQLSVLQEVGNVLVGSYLNALSQMTGLRLEPTPPALGVDIAAALLSAVAAEVALETDVALLVETTLGGSDKDLAGGRFIYLPTAAGLERVLQGLGLRT